MPASLAAPHDVRLAEVSRGAHVESEHSGALAIAFEDGSGWSVGDAARPVWTRSAIKPLQALPLVETGVAARLGLSAAELALCCASHDGTALHVATAERLLARGGLQPGQLGCGPHAPFDQAASLAIARAGGKPQRIHNNCSGKHSGFLLLAQSLGQDLARYLEPDGASQVLVRTVVADFADLDPAAIEIAVDGCGAPTLRLPLAALARAFCRLMNPSGQGAVREAACAVIRSAIDAAPVHLAGEGRLGTLLVRSAPGRVVPKNGAEGIYAVAGVGLRGAFGLAVKVRDGAERGYFPVVVAALERLGLWPDGTVPEALRAFACVPILNTNRERVGEVRNALELPSSW